jgi:HEPN domain-containing protein
MRANTRSWIDFALQDLDAAKRLAIEEHLGNIDDIYTDLRYPGCRGFLPAGIPTAGQAKQFVVLAEKAYGIVSRILL